MKWRVFITGRNTLFDFLSANEPAGIRSATYYRGVLKPIDVVVIEAENTFDFTTLLPSVLDELPAVVLDTPWDNVSEATKAQYRIKAGRIDSAINLRVHADWEDAICHLLRTLGINQQKLRKYESARTREFLDGFA